MIIGVWNLESYPAASSPIGKAMSRVLRRYPADVWFLTELHADWRIKDHALHFANPRTEAEPYKRKAAITSRWPMEAIPTRDYPVEGRTAMARLTHPVTGETLLAACTALPWRGVTPQWRERWGREVTYTEVYLHYLQYNLDRIAEQLLPGEPLIWGGDFNQGLFGRDYVGTTVGRNAILNAMDELGLQVPTGNLAALTPTHPAIDHIAVPRDWVLHQEPIVKRPKRNGRHLSDHALYLVEASPTIG